MDAPEDDALEGNFQSKAKSARLPQNRAVIDMVANCAHDLKTPLAAVYNSNQLAISILCDVQASLARHPSIPESLLSDLAVAKCTLEAALNMSEFMTMSINRCMDFAKVANHGMKLAPKLETVDVAAALDLPVRCMAAVSEEQTIGLRPLPSDLCSHIITDSQWLQENVLCLLSNAVKYSSHGTVNLGLSLESEAAVLAKKKSQQGFGSASTACLSEDNARDSNFTWPVPDSIDDLLESSTKSFFDDAPVSGPTLGLGLGFGSGGASPQSDRVMVLVECEDTGIGLTEEAMANLFAPFKQAQRLAGGTGLGLFSLANRMAALNGHCGVHSRADGAQGSLFWFAFPYKPDLAAAVEAVEEREGAAGAGPGGGGLTAANLAQLGERMSRVTTNSSSSSPLGGIPAYDRRISRSALKTVPSMQALSTTGATSSFSATTGYVRVSLPTSPAPTVTPRAARQLVTRSSQGPLCSSPWSSCPPSPALVSRPLGADSPGTEADVLAAEDALHILLVDDTTSIRKLCSRMLAREGYRVSTAENGFEALKLLLTARFEAVLMDLQMPVMDGLEAVRRFRAAEQVPPGRRRLFIVAVSANADPSVADSLQAGGFDGFIEKPFTVARLQAVLPADLGV